VCLRKPAKQGEQENAAISITHLYMILSDWVGFESGGAETPPKDRNKFLLDYEGLVPAS